MLASGNSEGAMNFGKIARNSALLFLIGKYDLSFELSEPKAYRRDVPNAPIHVLDARLFALDTAADEIADLVRGFIGSSH